MKPIQKSIVYLVLVAIAFAGSTAMAQQVTGELGSPSATTTISGKQLPAPEPKFGGVIKDDALNSKPWWAPRIVPPKQAPNILLIITDDAGFGVPSTFGGVIPDADHGPRRKERSPLQQHSFHSAMLADARRIDYRAQPSLGGLWRDLRAVHGFPRLQQHHRRGQGHHRADSAR